MTNRDVISILAMLVFAACGIAGLKFADTLFIAVPFIVAMVFSGLIAIVMSIRW